MSRNCSRASASRTGSGACGPPIGWPTSRARTSPPGRPPDDGCPFCSIPKLSDEDGLIIARGSSVFAVLNLYPYNGGHLMVVPYRHVADYTDLDDAETAELADYTKRAMTALRAASGRAPASTSA
ncbi:hypothetical protein FHR36_001981 [Kitasatospora paracochleata]|uniref:HIT domain-containing protein n=1 Tax=Kitasatospora paracochleata TaxID=58354 RepID=A0ABT1IUN9_9ACTN|nr:hypothetical protein [Kitasatospora paracochleata]